jgi:hypothetical protein
MTLRIEKSDYGESPFLRLIGQIQEQHLEGLKAQMQSHGPGTVLDLEEVTLVDVDVVRFLATCEAGGTLLLHCPPYIREWIRRELKGGRRT